MPLRPPSLDGVDCIGIDGFAVRRGHIYKTIVVDLRGGRILYVGEGKGADALNGFWERIKRKGVDIKYIATDLSAALFRPYMNIVSTQFMFLIISMWSSS